MRYRRVRRGGRGYPAWLARFARERRHARRQMVALREKMSDQESRLRDMIRHGAENDALGEKLHRLTLALFGAADLDTTLAVLYQSLQEDFGVPQVAARLWGQIPEQSYL